MSGVGGFMKITHDDIMKFVSHGNPAGKFNPGVIVYSEDELKANIYNAMVWVQKCLQQFTQPRPE